MINAIKTFFRPMLKERFLAGLLVSNAIAVVFVLLWFFLERTPRIQSIDDIAEFFFMFWIFYVLAIIFSVIFGVPTFLVFEKFGLRKLWQYVSAGLLVGLLVGLFSGVIELYVLCIMCGFIITSIFWYITIRPLEKK